MSTTRKEATIFVSYLPSEGCRVAPRPSLSRTNQYTNVVSAQQQIKASLTYGTTQEWKFVVQKSDLADMAINDREMVKLRIDMENESSESSLIYRTRLDIAVERDVSKASCNLSGTRTSSSCTELNLFSQSFWEWWLSTRRKNIFTRNLKNAAKRLATNAYTILPACNALS